MSLNMRPQLPTTAIVAAGSAFAEGCNCAMCGLREAGKGLREFNPDQPRDRGRWTKGGGPGSRTSGKGGAVPGKQDKPQAAKSQVGISKDTSRVTPRKAGLPANIGRAIFARAGKAAGYKENG